MRKPLHCVFGCFSETKEDGGSPCWFQTTPAYGEYDGGGSVLDAEGDPIAGAKIVFDEDAARRIVEAFEAERAEPGFTGVLVDREHFSCDADKPSDAMAWAVDIRVEEDGSVWTKWEFTPKGRELYESKTLVSRSPVLRLEKTGEKTYRPYRLDSIGMTNTPHFKTLSPTAAAKAAANDNPKGDSTMDPEIIAALGLAEGATKEDALAAVKALKDAQAAAEAKATEAEKKQQEAEAKCRAHEADAFVAANADKIADAAAFKAVYVKDPELARKAIGAFKAQTATAPTTRIAAKEAKTPSPSGDAKAVAREKAIADYRAAHGCSFATAWGACRAASPDLFAD